MTQVRELVVDVNRAKRTKCALLVLPSREFSLYTASVPKPTLTHTIIDLPNNVLYNVTVYMYIAIVVRIHTVAIPTLKWL